MGIGSYRTCVRAIHVVVLASVLAFACVEAFFQYADFEGIGRALLFLTSFGGWVAYSQAAGPRDTEAPRMSTTFVLAALLLLPVSAVIIVGMVVALSVRRASFFSDRSNGSAQLVGSATATAIAAFAMTFGPAAATPGTPGALVTLIVAFVFIYAFARVVSTAVDSDPFETEWRLTTSELRRMGVESFSILPGWILAASLHRGAWLEATTTAVAISGVAIALSRGSRTQQNFRRTRADLETREAELAAVHAIGREIVTAVQPLRVFEIIERECSKLLDVEDCLIAVPDQPGGRLRMGYRRGGNPGMTRRDDTLRTGLINSVAVSQAARCVSSAQGLDTSDEDRLQNLEAISGMAAPMIVSGQVIGVISIESTQRDAYDDRQLAVMTTIAQQAAVAIENVRHYRLATTDTLTGFFSRDHFFERLEGEHRRVRRYGGRFAVLMLDLDGFKEINDSCGHLAGDEYLRNIGDTVRSKLRHADLPCRYGGDEFCVLLPETGLDGARVIAERIRDAVSRKNVGLDGLHMRTTVSIGLAAFPEHDRGRVYGLLRNADDALYRAKREGRNRVVPFAA